MKKYIGCDAHARYSIFASISEDGGWDAPVRVEHNELEMERYLKQLPPGSPVALERFGELVLAGAREGRGWTGAEAGACMRSQEAHAGPEQDGPFRRQGMGDDVAQWLVTGSMDSAGAVAGFARSDAYTFGHAATRQRVEVPDLGGFTTLWRAAV